MVNYDTCVADLQCLILIHVHVLYFTNETIYLKPFSNVVVIVQTVKL